MSDCQQKHLNDYCTERNVTYFDITNDGYIWFKEDSEEGFVCQKDANISQSLKETKCESTYYVYSEDEKVVVSTKKHKNSLKVKQTQVCPSTVGCVNNVKSHIFAQNSERSNVCAAASALVECNLFCKTNCQRNSRNFGIFQLIYSTTSDEEIGAQIGPLQEWYCPKGKEKRKIFIDPWLWAIIGIAIFLIVVVICLIVVKCVRKKNWRIGSSARKKCSCSFKNCKPLRCCRKTKKTSKGEPMTGAHESPVVKRVATLGSGNKEL